MRIKQVNTFKVLLDNNISTNNYYPRIKHEINKPLVVINRHSYL